MAEKSLWFRMFGEDRVTPVFKKVGDEAELTAAKVRASFAEAGAMVGGPIGKGAGTANKAMTGLGRGSVMTAGIIVGAVGAIAYHTTKMAGDFQAAIVRLQTTAGESKKNLDLVSNGILSMAGKVGYSAQELATGMYTVESAGFHGAQGLKVMTAAAKGARTEGADLTTVTDAVTSAMVDFHLHGAKGAAEATNTLIAAVGHGKTTMEGMAAAFPNVAAAAAGVGVSMQETAAAIATMTQHGTDAAKAGTYLRQMLGQLASGGSAQAQKALHAVGLSAAGVSKELGTQGLAATIKTLQQAIDDKLNPAARRQLQVFEHSKTPLASYQMLMNKSGKGTMTAFGALTKMVGGVKSLQGILQLGGENLKTFRHNTAAVSEQVRKGGKDVEGYAEYQKTFNAKVADAKSALSALGVSIGTDILPGMTKFVGALATATSWLGKHKTAVEIVGGALGAAAAAFLVLTAATWAWNVALDANPIVLIIAGLAALGVGLVLAYKKSETFRNIVNGVWNAVKGAAMAVVHWFTGSFVPFFTTTIPNAFHAVLNWAKAHWPLLVGIITGPFGLLVAEVIHHWSQITAAFSAAWSKVKSLTSSAWHAITSAFSSAWHAITHAVSSGVSNVVGFFKSLPHRILSALGDLGHLLWDAGTQVLEGLMGGIRSKMGELASQVQGIGSSILGHIKGALGIHSPSREMAIVGGYIIDGLIQGMNAKKGELQTMLQSITAMVQQTGQQLQTDMQARMSFQQGFVSTYASSPFGATNAKGNPAGLHQMFAAQQKALYQALQLKHDTRKLIGEGLSQSLLQQLASAGPSGLAQIHALASTSVARVHRLNRLDRQTNTALGQAAGAAGADIYGARIAADRQAHDAAKIMAEAVKDAIHKQQIGPNVHKAIKEGFNEAQLHRMTREGTKEGAALGSKAGAKELEPVLSQILGAIQHQPQQTLTKQRQHGGTRKKK